MHGRAAKAGSGVAAALIAAAAVAQPGIPALGRQAFLSVTGGADPARNAALVRDSINGAGGLCARVVRYQLFRRTPMVATLKVECAGRPEYLLSLDAEGGLLVDGGDGRVTAIDAAEGPVVNAPRPSVSEAVVAAMTPAPDAAGAGSRWLFAPLALGLVAAAYLLYRRAARRAALPRHDSAAKNRMIAEARELAPGLWRHPSGLWIARGKRGKRRLFPNRPFAEAYRRWGFKIAQVR